MGSIKKITIIGVGFMGGSLALSIKKKFPGIFVTGYARSNPTYKKLTRLNIVDEVQGDLGKAVCDSDVVVLGAPIYSIIDYFKKISPFLKPGTIIIDLGSTKELIQKKALKYLPKNTYFVGCHPLCGSDKSGAQFSTPNLYKGAICIISSSANKKALQKIESLWKALGCRVILVNAKTHDKILSSVSHLVHVISFSLTGFVPKTNLKFAATSLRDLTRISNSPAAVWADILISNKNNITEDIKKFIKILENFKELIKKERKEKILKLIKDINKKQKIISALH
ncbi:MAG: prephenate dehydrogenase [Candidatus Omnitrophota bacterium]